MASSCVNSEDCLENEEYAQLGDDDSDFVDLEYEKSKSLSEEYIHACHGMIFSRSEKILWNTFKLRGCVLMQMRFDGVLGFPGGLVEKGEDPLIGLNREMEEEIGLEVNKHGFTDADHMHTVLNKRKRLVLHFFTKEVSEEEFLVLEKNHLKAEEYGIEVMGIIRVPLFTMSDGLRGLPAFLSNQFIGNARNQLLAGLKHTQLLKREEIEKALESSNKHLAQSPRKL
ncbi:U8 snoRNA-decapping enzyme-like [Littorina saxatilis]|uniref:U8 snoRNA-decapping enzyme n=1 Tax=Littorina saxatilis TaxID=31220 RepID=A0AAN9B9P3_9CAEN